MITVARTQEPNSRNARIPQGSQCFLMTGRVLVGARARQRSGSSAAFVVFPEGKAQILQERLVSGQGWSAVKARPL